MSRVLTNEQNYYDIANTIRQMKNVNTTYKPREMASALKDIYSNEVEGLPPLSFEANGNNLLNYKIDGAIGGVGDRTSNLFDKNNPTMLTELYMSVTGLANVTSSYSHSIVIPCTPATTYSIKFKYETYTLRIASFSSYPTANKVGNDVNNVANGTPCNNASYTTSETANYLLIFCYNVATPESSNYSIDEFFSEIIVSESQIPLPYEPYGYKVPVVVNGKNLLQNTATTQTKNGVTFTVNNDKSITCNGTASSNAFFKIGDIQLKKNCIMSGCPEGGANNSYVMRLYNNGAVFKTDSGNGVLINSEIQNGYAEIRIAAGYTCDNLTFYPMIRLAEIEDNTYEPYIKETTNIYLDNPIRTVEDEVEYIDYSEQKQHRVRKNQVVSNVTSRTIDNGDGTFFYITANHDGSVTCNGYAKSTTFISNSYIAELEANTSYILSGCPQGGKYMSYRLDFRTPAGQTIDPIVDYGDGYTFSVDTPGIYVPTVRIAAGYTCNNLTFYPMIRKADIEDDTYEPYIENTEVDVTLPAIPTLDGTNTLSIDTTVQPSNVYIQAPKDSIEATQIANRLEEI